MKLFIVFFFLLIALPVFANGRGVTSAVTTVAVDCGLSADTSKCGNTGAAASLVSEAQSTQAYWDGLPGGQKLSACSTSLTSNTDYEVTADILVNKTTQCFNAGVGIHIYLNGHTIWGYVYGNASMNGFRIFGGSIVCNRAPSGANQGCVNLIMSDSSITNPIAYHHLTLTQENTTDPAWTMYNDVGVPTDSSGSFALQVYNVESVVANCNTCSRSGFYGQAGGSLKFYGHRNKITCASTAAACQGFSISGSINVRSLIELNYCTAVNNATETARCVAADANSLNSLTSSDLVEARYNYMDTSTARALRCRSRYCYYHDNLIANGTIGSTTGQIHVGDQNDPRYSDDYCPARSGTTSVACSRVETNIFINPISGTAVWARLGQNFLVRYTKLWGSQNAMAGLLNVNAVYQVNGTISSISCTTGIATYTLASSHGLNSGNGGNIYGIRFTAAGTTGGFDVTNGLAADVPGGSTVTYNFGTCPSGSGSGGTFVTDGTTVLYAIDNDVFNTTSNILATSQTSAAPTGQSVGLAGVKHCNSGTATVNASGLNSSNSALSPCQ